MEKSHFDPLEPLLTLDQILSNEPLQIGREVKLKEKGKETEIKYIVVKQVIPVEELQEIKDKIDKVSTQISDNHLNITASVKILPGSSKFHEIMLHTIRNYPTASLKFFGKAILLLTFIVIAVSFFLRIRLVHPTILFCGLYFGLFMTLMAIANNKEKKDL